MNRERWTKLVTEWNEIPAPYVAVGYGLLTFRDAGPEDKIQFLWWNGVVETMGFVFPIRNRIYKHIDHPINLKITAPPDEEEITVRVRWDDSANTFVDVENPKLGLVLLTGNEIPR